MTEPYWEPLAAGVPLPPVVNGQWVKGVGGAAVWAPIAQADLPPVPYGTSLPASPFDGQEAILVDNVTNPSYQWRFRFNASNTTAWKWEFVGGAPAYAVDLSGSARQNNTASTWQWITGMPTFNVPRTGQYRWRFGAWLFTTNPFDTIYVGLGTVATPPGAILNPNALHARGNHTGNDNITVSNTDDDRAMGITRGAGNVIGVIIYSAPPANVYATYPWLEVTPMTVA